MTRTTRPEPPPGTGMLDAGEAAARLGVKRATLYAYVSRGLLASTRGAGRESRFDAAEVAALARRGAGRSPGGGIHVSSTVTEIRDRRLFYRGRDLEALLRTGVPYERVAEGLWGLAPAEGVAWRVEAPLAARLARMLRLLPAATPLLDRLRMVAALASAADDLRHDLRREAVAVRAAGLIAQFVEALGGARSAGLSIAARLWTGLTPRRPSAAGVSALNAALVALADHDLAASTFAVRIAASVRADPYSAVGAGLGALGGPLHGMASRRVRLLLSEALRVGASRAVGQVLRDARQMPGFGHPLYPGGDPRASWLLGRVLELGAARRLVRTIVEVRDLVGDQSGAPPNVDFALAALAVAADMREDAGEAMFAVARTAGWIAHAMDEYAEPEVAFRYRPVARYVGPKF